MISNPQYAFIASLPSLSKNVPPRSPLFSFNIADLEPEEVEPEGEAESNRTYCKCNSACKTKRKTGSNRGCPCRTANLSSVSSMQMWDVPTMCEHGKSSTKSLRASGFP